MYIAAALCLWALKVWKLGQLELDAAAKRQFPTDISPVERDPEVPLASATAKPSPALHRMIRWTKV